MIRKVILHGSLAEQFGNDPIELDVNSPQSLISGLSCVVNGFEKAFRKCSNFQLVQVDRDKKTVTYVTPQTWEFDLTSTDEIHLVPTAEGAGFEVAVAWGFAAGTFGYYAVGIAVNLAITMAVSAISSKLSPMPDSSGSTHTPAAERPSFVFNQVLNVTSPGHPVPLVYGRCLTGSVVISVGLQTEQT